MHVSETRAPPAPRWLLPFGTPLVLPMCRRRQGELDEAAALYSRALAIKEAVLGPHHLDVATGCNNLAACHREQVRSGE